MEASYSYHYGSYYLIAGNMRSLRFISKQMQNRYHCNKNIKLCTSCCHTSMPINNLHRIQTQAYDNHQSIYKIITHRSYGSKTNIEFEEQDLPNMDAIKPYMRTGLIGTHAEGSNTEFVVSFLGTGGGSPTRHRLGSCTALRLGGQTFLFDVTEGALRQLDFSPILPSSITKIFISHLHGDHLFGLVPMILGIMVSHKMRMSSPRKQSVKRKHLLEHGEIPTLEIFGPPGLFNYINMVLTLSCSKVNYLNINVIELVGGRMERGPMSSRPKHRGGRNVFLSHYPEIETPLITRKYLEKNKDGVWVIDEPEPITDATIENFVIDGAPQDGYHRLPNDVNLSVGRRLHIKAAELDHLNGVQTFGYTVEEQPPPGTIDLEKAKAAGVAPGKKYGLLKCGLSVPNDDGTGVVHPDEVLVRTFMPRKIAVLSDHRFVLQPMKELCRNADLLVHEATLSKEDGLDVSSIVTTKLFYLIHVAPSSLRL